MAALADYFDALRDLDSLRGVSQMDTAFRFAALPASRAGVKATAISASSPAFHERFVPVEPFSYVAVALARRRGRAPEAVADAVNDAGVGLRERGLDASAGHVASAALALALAVSGSVAPELLDRTALIHKAWRKDHPWITGVEDFTPAALHALRPGPADAAARRCEEIFQSLARAGRWKTDWLQAVSLILALADGAPKDPIHRMELLHGALRDRKFDPEWDWFGETALLSLSKRPVAELARERAEIYGRLRERSGAMPMDASLLSTLLILDDESGLENVRDGMTMAWACMSGGAR